MDECRVKKSVIFLFPFPTFFATLFIALDRDAYANNEDDRRGTGLNEARV